MLDHKWRMPMGFALMFMVLSGILFLALLEYADRTLYRMEAQEAIHRGNELKGFLDYQSKQLDLLCIDWSNWDQAYRFVLGQEGPFQSENLNFMSFDGSDISHAVFFRKDLSVRWHGRYIKGSKTLLKCSGDEISAFRDLVLRSQRAGYSRGLMVLDNQIYLVSARQVRDSALALPAVGWLVITRPLPRVNDMNQVVPGLTELLPRRGYDITAESPMALSQAVAVPMGPSLMEASIVLTDVMGRPSMEGRLKMSRWIAMEVRRLMARVLFGVAILGIGISTALITWHRANISEPLERIYERVAKMTASGHLEALPLDSSEVAGIAKAMNALITHAKKVERRNMTGERRMRDMLDGMDLMVALCSADGTINFANRPMKALFDDLEPLEGRMVWDLLDPEDRERMREKFIAATEGEKPLIRFHLRTRRTSLVVNMWGIKHQGREVMVLCRSTSASLPPGVFA